MSSFASTTLAGVSSRAFDAAFTSTTSQSGETTVRFGDGEHGAALPLGSSVLRAIHAAGGGASGHAPAATLQSSAHAEERGLHPWGATGSPQPQAGDEVLVAFEHGQMRHPFVAGLLWNSADEPPQSHGAGEVEHAHPHGAPPPPDGIGEAGESESLRLQMAMERLSKMMSTLSSLLQRIGTTDAAIAQDLK